MAVSVHRCTAPPGAMEGGEGSNRVATIFVSQKSNLAKPLHYASDICRPAPNHTDFRCLISHLRVCG